MIAYGVDRNRVVVPYVVDRNTVVYLTLLTGTQWCSLRCGQEQNGGPIQF
jgi:hypothetical protein